ncbi:hypothetical protein Tco_0324371 [Tanacetum coccineum]
MVKSLRTWRGDHRGRITSCEETWSSRYDVRGPSGQRLRPWGKLGQALRRARKTTGPGFTTCEEHGNVATTCEDRRGSFTTCDKPWSSRYDVRGTVGAGLRRARKVGQVATTCEETSGRFYDVRDPWSKSLTRARNRRAPLRRARKLGQVCYTTAEETLICPISLLRSLLVYNGLGNDENIEYR